jgi:hypothetical protein
MERELESEDLKFNLINSKDLYSQTPLIRDSATKSPPKKSPLFNSK